MTPQAHLRSLSLALLLLAGGTPAWASTETAGWTPVASERLIKLPGSYLRKAVENDFAGSGLAAEIREVEGRMALKSETLADLQAAIEQADGDLEVELQHQFLAEKRSYLELVGRHQDLRRQQMNTKLRLYEKLLAKLDRQGAAMTPQRQALIDKQEEAKRRFERSIAQVDLKVFSTPAAHQSKYAKEYAQNVVAIERLVQAINAHPMNAQSQINGQPVTKKEYLRQLVAESQAEIEIVDQEETVLGYMAKLIALDALALSDLLADRAAPYGAAPEGEESGIASAVDFFVTQ